MTMDEAREKIQTVSYLERDLAILKEKNEPGKYAFIESLVASSYIAGIERGRREISSAVLDIIDTE
ncbi:hypothetical protein FACS1894110_10010 [Spirochaetia bacterium]|nr:hypothetical protein FACS1894110_10010 [Spirochaetia bacterium]